MDSSKWVGMGPVYFRSSLCQVDARATAKYKGVHFGLLREKRSEFKGRDGPGPGLYDPKPTSDAVSKVSMGFRLSCTVLSQLGLHKGHCVCVCVCVCACVCVRVCTCVCVHALSNVHT